MPPPTPSQFTPPQRPPAGWYPNPDGRGQRYWNGVNWTQQVADAPIGIDPEASFETELHAKHVANRQWVMAAGAFMLAITLAVIVLTGGFQSSSAPPAKSEVPAAVEGLGGSAGSIRARGELCKQLAQHTETAQADCENELIGAENYAEERFGR